jgi:hypothetical protein
VNIFWSDLSYDFYDYPLVYFMVCPELRLLWLPLWCILWSDLSYDFYDYPLVYLSNTGGELGFVERVSRSCSTQFTRLVTNSVISYEWGKGVIINRGKVWYPISSLSIKKKSHKEWYWSQAALDPLMDTYIYIISAYSFSVSIKIFDMFLYLGGCLIAVMFLLQCMHTKEVHAITINCWFYEVPKCEYLLRTIIFYFILNITFNYHRKLM